MTSRRWIGSLALTLSLLGACGGPGDPATDCRVDGCDDSTRVCVDQEDGTASCECPDGTLDEMGACVEPSGCMDGECGAHGMCDGAACACEAGYAGTRCERCDDGFHDDGDGGCTDDVCLPDPCEPGRVCAAAPGGFECACPAGQHDAEGACVPDTTCMAGTCAGNGSCDDAGGAVVCSCDVGWEGTHCDTCDEANGYHDDGAGGCTTDRCLPNPCTSPNQSVCTDDPDEGVLCACDSGYHDDGGGGCAIDEVCDGRCGDHGTCSDAGGVVVCGCDVGWTGAACDACDAAGGYHDDGVGGCTDDACLPNLCAEANRSVCAVEGDGSTSCGCDAGYHDDGGACVIDEECAPTTCNMRGTCELTAGVVSCHCATGWTGDYCDACDATMGYHDDGMGGCTTDVCLPNPCVEANRSVCAPDGGGGTTCSCDAGSHEDDGACVIDEACTATSCNGHGACSDGGGVVVCVCATGWAGDYCDACDAAMGYHDDGMRGCTMDVCLPNPCRDANQSVCSDVGGSASCACDAGYHDDGVGGCTNDPCVPDPCAASGQLCRDLGGGAHECYVPTCDDGEDCTDDSFDGTECVFAPRGDGESCSSTLCTSGQTCTSGACGGGTVVTCDDSNPCTDDACDAVTGCDNAPNDATVPDDGLACTVDACSGGAQSHTPDDGVCTDGLWCSGDEVCAPTDPDAAADGCVTRDAPSAPGPDGPCGTWSCDEPSRSWQMNAIGSGTNCDDRIDCTTGDACDGAGACRGTPTALCGGGPGTCATTTPFGTGGIDVPRASLIGALTYAGAPPAASGNDDNVDLWLRDQATGQLVHLEQIDFGAHDGSEYPVRSWDFRDDHVVDQDVIPGAYDVIYRRFWSGDEEREWGAQADGTYPFGSHVLMSVVLGPGTNDITFDIPNAAITGSLTFDGSPAVGSGNDDNVDLWLRDQATGSLVHLEQIDFGAYDGSAYPVRSRDFRDDRVIDMDVLPGTYDVIYRRFWSGDEEREWGAQADGTYPFGSHVLMRDVVLGPGTTTLAVDIPAAHLSGALTFDGAPAVGSSNDDNVDLWLRDTETGSLVHLEQIDFGAYDGSEYPVRSWDFRDDRVIDMDVLPGTYDVIYRRFWSGDEEREWGAQGDDTYPFGSHVLMPGVVVGAGENTFDVDIPAAHVSGTLTFDGAVAVGSGNDDNVDLWLRDQATGSLVHLEQIDFGAYDGSEYPVRSWDFRDDRVIDMDVLPGTYDIIYRRFWSGDELREWGAQADGSYPFGSHVLVADVVIGAGASILDVDIPAASVTGVLTFAGAPAIGSSNDDNVDLWLRDQATGQLVHLEQIDFGAHDGSQYPVRSWDFRDDRAIAMDLLPGTYDILYRRFWSGDELREWGAQADGTYAFGSHVLVADVVIGAGSGTLNVDIPRAAIDGPLTFAGGPAVASGNDDNVDVWLRDRATGSLVHIEQIDFGAQSGGQYPVRSWDFRDDRLIDLDVTPGTYDLLYRRFWSGDEEREWGARADGTYPFGSHLLRQCVSLP